MADWLASLRDAIAQADSVEEARAAVEALGTGPAAAYSEHALYGPGGPEPFFRLTFAPPVPARELCETLGWERPYAFSPDVHMTSWAIALWDRDLADPYGRRIALRRPTLGIWEITPYLTGWPRGDSPNLVAGASSAYDMWTYPAEVAFLELRRGGGQHG